MPNFDFSVRIKKNNAEPIYFRSSVTLETGTKRDAMHFFAVELEPTQLYLTFNILDSLTFYEKLNIRYKNKSVVEKPFYSNEKG